jgi:hypothetical protein
VQAAAELEERLAVEGPAALTPAELHIALGLPGKPPSPTLSPTAADAPRYTPTEAHAYALARFPGCWAAVQRVVAEVAARLPGFKPRSVLDFGAGPGTASWALQEVRMHSHQAVLMCCPSLSLDTTPATLSSPHTTTSHTTVTPGHGP